MHNNEGVYQYFIDNTERLTEEWYKNLTKNDPKGVYASTDSYAIETIKKQNNDFHHRLAGQFIKDKEEFLEDIKEWIFKIATDQAHLDTPIHFIIREFIRTREQYFQLIEEYATKHHVGQERVIEWSHGVVKVLDEIILKYTEEHHNYSNRQLVAQQEMINELSSPVISLSNSRALLPLVGDIDTARAASILENSIKQCAEKRVSRLFIDLSGVVIIDTMVAHQIFQLINGLSLIGVKTTLSGIRPEIATTAIQLGLSFTDISIASTLSKAIEQDGNLKK
ncbi:STAS domain-containing protein [Niallia alba]|uniref:STAS domain-containing protein n=1 Tax=Niallia alba TaxID=2729105 RepID=UPI0039A284E0